ncbi:MAG: SDR family NAD(P)-dependent oxidoreductase [Pseudorhodoplanes sp.]|jgi:NAD(P)-dependent dehydrogenase (short-subunit alcohol dehydrogenase family)|nr:SDR family NAD(P)-dependent oxidoreductase [Pseudorhodoplanes sp.]
MNFSGRHVIVTGGTGALGTALVGALIRAGAHCHVPFIETRASPHFEHAQNASVTLHAQVDLSDDAQVTKLYAALPSLWASIHLAGGFAASKITDTSKADLMQMIDTNLVSAFLCSREAVKIMTRGGSGRVVNVAARPALEPRSGAGMTAYTVSKAGVAALTAALAEEVVRQDILVNAVAPSVMDTAANRAAMPKADHAKWPKVDEVAATILFLASPENRVTRGAVVQVYGKT